MVLYYIVQHNDDKYNHNDDKCNHNDDKYNHNISDENGPAEQVELKQCPSCKRSMNERALKTHKKICKKVFMKKRKTFKVQVS